MRPDVDPVAKLTAIIKSRPDDFRNALDALSKGERKTGPELMADAGEFAKWLTEFFSSAWKIDFIPYALDDINGDERRGRLFLSLVLEAYLYEIEDIQAEIGNNLRRAVEFLKNFAPGLDFLNEISRDSYARRPLDRLRRMKPAAIFEDMSVSDDAEADALLDALEKNFTPVFPDVASTADTMRNEWLGWARLEDEREELLFFEVVERALTHLVATESRIAQTAWVLNNLDGDALLLGLLDISRKGLECLTMFCGNFKFVDSQRYFIQELLEVGR